MTKGRAILAALCALAALAGRVGHTSPGAADAGAGSTDRELRAVAEAWRAHYNAKDAAAVAALYAEDGYYVSAHVVAHGRAEIRAYFQRGIDAGGHIDSIELLASGHSGELSYWVGTYEATNAGQKVRGRNVVVARKVGGKWLMVAHETVVADRP
jgi:ketosteroid isomerase-like protein